MQIEVQCSRNYFKFVLPQEAGAFGNNIKKDPQRPRPKTEKICILFIYREYLLCLQSNVSSSFFQKYINFVEERLKISHFESSIIP